MSDSAWSNDKRRPQSHAGDKKKIERKAVFSEDLEVNWCGKQ